jgi:prolyl oligopeptidase
MHAQSLHYPETRTVDQVDDYHGTRVADPYRWLEDVTAPEVAAWVGAQNELTFGYLEGLSAREALAQRMMELMDFPRVNGPIRAGGRTFWTANTGRQDHAVLHVRDAPDGEPRVLIDPNTFSADGSVSMSTWTPSPDGSLLAYGVRDSGSDWQTFHIRDAAIGRDLADSLRWVKFSDIVWTKDGGGFFYSRYDEPEGDPRTAPNAEHQLFHHRVGTPQSADRLVLRSEDHPEATLGAQVSDDGRYALVHQHRTRRNRTYLLDLGDPAQPTFDAPLVPLFTGFDASYSLVGSEGSKLYILTDDGAPMRRIITVDVERPGRNAWRTIVPEAASTLVHADVIGGRFVVEYLEDVKSAVRFYSLDGEPMGTLDLPGTGSVTFGPPGESGGFSGSPDDDDFYYSFQTFLDPGSVYRYDFATGQSTVHYASELPFDAEPYTMEQVFYTSADGTRVPMFIVRRSDLVLDGSHPVMLYGYGGFGASWPPAFAPFIPAWLEMGGIWAWANLRGGSEYGRAWHEAAMFERKQNAFDDFIAAGEYLIEEGYTRPERLAIHGASNGGLLVGAVMVQRPDLFAVALPDVGLYDMLRYHTFVAGQFGLSEYGSSDSPEGFEYLRAYSPLHNGEGGTCYPATLITTADHEDRVPPLHSYKFAAALQAAQGCENPVLLRVDTDAGHGFGMPLSQAMAKYADMWAFAAERLGMEVQPSGRSRERPERTGAMSADTVHVAPPTGERDIDRASILDALEQVRPGGTIRFDAGTYVIGEIIHVTVPGITIVGHPGGTTLRGCDPDVFTDTQIAVVACNGLDLAGGHQTVRNLTFEYAWHALVLGGMECFPSEGCLPVGEPVESRRGGYRVERNMFRRSQNPIRTLGEWLEPAVIRDNVFVDNFHAVAVHGSTVHVLDNQVSVPNPELVPSSLHPGEAMAISATDLGGGLALRCTDNIIAGNRIEGHTAGIQILAFARSAVSCRDNVIRGNTIAVKRVRVRGPGSPVRLRAGSDSTLVGVPIGLVGSPEGFSIAGVVHGVLEGTLIEGNRLLGAEGLGIEVFKASKNRIVDNTIAGIARRQPFPGNTSPWADPEKMGWGTANGSGIWISPGSDGNEIAGNTFEDIAGAAVVVEGDSNRVEMRSANDSVRDLGRANRVTAPGSVTDVARLETRGSADYHMHLSTAELARFMDASTRAMGSIPEDAPAVPGPTAADAIEALDHAGLTHGLVISGGYVWGSPLLRSPLVSALLDSLGVDTGDERARVRAENAHLSEEVARYPDRLIGACSVNPLAEYALDEIDLCAADPAIVAFKLHLANAGVDFDDASHVNGLRAFFEALAETDLAVIVHLRSRGEGYGDGDARTFIREVLAAAPGVPVQIAHMAGWGAYDEATDSAMQAFVDALEDGTLDRDRITFELLVVVEDPADAGADTARARQITERNVRLAERVRQVGIERVVFGSDWPFFPPVGEPLTRIARYREQLRSLLPLEPEEVDRVFTNRGGVFGGRYRERDR